VANLQIKDLVTVIPNIEDVLPISQGGNTRSATVQELRGVKDDFSGGSDNALSAEKGKKLYLEIDDIKTPLSATLSISPSLVETGSTVSLVELVWSYNKNIVSQTFESNAIDVALRTTTYTTPLTVDKTFTITATNENGTTITKTAKLDFENGIYYGKSISTTYDSTLINSLTKVLSGTKARTISVTAGTGEYIYYAIPSRLGTPIFTVGGFTGGFSKVATIAFTNSSGYSENYDIYRSDNSNLGATNVVIA